MKLVRNNVASTKTNSTAAAIGMAKLTSRARYGQLLRRALFGAGVVRRERCGCECCGCERCGCECCVDASAMRIDVWIVVFGVCEEGDEIAGTKEWIQRIGISIFASLINGMALAWWCRVFLSRPAATNEPRARANEQFANQAA